MHLRIAGDRGQLKRSPQAAAGSEGWRDSRPAVPRSAGYHLLFHIKIFLQSMTRLLFSTIRRHCPPTEHSGFLICVDHEAHRILARCPIIETGYLQIDSNRRGGTCGAKGISFHRNEVAISNNISVFCTTCGSARSHASATPTARGFTIFSIMETRPG